MNPLHTFSRAVARLGCRWLVPMALLFGFAAPVWAQATYPVTNVAATSADLHGALKTSQGRFRIDEYRNGNTLVSSTSTPILNGGFNGSDYLFDYVLGDLRPNTLYWVNIADIYGNIQGSWTSFATLTRAPIQFSGQIANENPYLNRLAPSMHATVNNGGEPTTTVVKYGVEGTHERQQQVGTIAANGLYNGETQQDFYWTFDPLEPGVTYKYETVSTNSRGSRTTGVLSYTTTPSQTLSAIGTTLAVGRQPLDLVVTGSNFSNGWSVVRVNGTEVPTDFNSDSQLTAHIPATLLTDKVAAITVANRSSGRNLTASKQLSLLQAPLAFNATDGTYDGYIRLSWTDDTDLEDGYRIYRDGTLIQTVGANTNSYDDQAAAVLPGGGYTYSVRAYKTVSGTDLLSTAVTDVGRRAPNGTLSGKVGAGATTGAGVANVTLTVTSNLGRALQLDGIDDDVQLDGAFDLANKSFSIETWIKRGQLNRSDYFISAGREAVNEGLHFGFRPNNRLTLGFYGNDLDAPVDTDLGWHHWTGTYDATTRTRKIYRDGVLVAQDVATSNYLGSGQLHFGAYLVAPALGQLDEIRIWSRALTPDEVATHWSRVLVGNERDASNASLVSGLLGNFHFDESSGTAVVNSVVRPENVAAIHGTLRNGAGYTAEGVKSPANHATRTGVDGAYSLTGIVYSTPASSSTAFTLTPTLVGHDRFAPASKSVTLTSTASTATGQDFADLSAFEVTGTVTLGSSGCAAQGVGIEVNDGPNGAFQNKGTTGPDGTYKVSLLAGQYIIRPVFNTSSFAYTGTATGNLDPTTPGQFKFDFTRNVAGVDFRNTTTYELSGTFRGACNANIGEMTLLVKSVGNSCFEQTVTTQGGNYRLTLVPQKYTVSFVASASNDPKIAEFFKTAVEVDLSQGDATRHFIYRAPPRVVVTGWPSAPVPTGTPSPDAVTVPVLKMNRPYTVTLQMVEGTSNCPLDSGRIRIVDMSGNRQRDTTVQIVGKKATYVVVPGIPTLVAPYQKLIEFTGETSEGIATAPVQQRVVVTGDKSRGQMFTTTSPQQPLLVLHDPPGDGSSATIEKGTVFSKEFTLSGAASVESETYGKFLFGDGASHVTNGLDFNLKVGVKFGGSDTYGYTLTTNKTIQTSSGDELMGVQSDLIFGAALNITYGLTDVVEIDPATGAVRQEVDPNTLQLRLPVTLKFVPTGFQTEVLYSVEHVRNRLLPELRDLRALTDISSLAGRKQYDVYSQSIQAWQNILDSNRVAIGRAEKLVNRSFDGGGQFTYTETVERSKASNWNFDIWLDASLGYAGQISYDVSAFFVGEWGTRVNIRGEFNRSETTTNADILTTGYTLHDDDLGDVFSVDVLKDKTWGTPAFKLIGGRSSNPWEPGTTKRDSVRIGATPLTQVDVDPGTPATFIVNLDNLSPTQEQRTYHLSVLQESNPNGAVIKVNGVPMGSYLAYTIPARTSQALTLTVERGPNAYDYDNLQLMVTTPWDTEYFKTGNGVLNADTLALSVHFKRPCSPITLFRPEPNWLVTSRTPSSVPFTLTNYDRTLASLESIGIEYRKIGSTQWLPGPQYTRAALQAMPDPYVADSWAVGSFNDGAYELRATCSCANGKQTVTAPVAGLIDRKGPVVFGQPQPKSGILNASDDISVTFNEALDPARLTASQIRLENHATGQPLPVDWTTNGPTLILYPRSAPAEIEGLTLRATVTGVQDAFGNAMVIPMSWTFTVRRSAVTQRIEFAPGMTYFSFNVQQDLFSPNALLRTLTPENGDIVRSQFGFSQYLTGAGWVGSLDRLAHGQGFAMRLAGRNVLELSGVPVEPTTPITLGAGWNWLGYLPQRAGAINPSLASLTGSGAGDVIKSVNRGLFSQFVPGSGWIGSLTELAPGEAYLLKLSANGTLMYPANGSARMLADADRTVDTTEATISSQVADAIAQARLEASQTAGTGPASAQSVPAWVVSPGGFQHNMTLVASVSDLAEGDLVAAFVGSQLRGVARPVAIPGTAQRLAFLMVYSNAAAGETVRFEVYRAALDAVAPLGRTVAFASDGSLGSITAPLRLEGSVAVAEPGGVAAPKAFALLQNSPNPFNPTTSIGYDLPSASEVHLEVFDLQGRLVRTLINGSQAAGRHMVAFDARDAQGQSLPTGMYVYRLRAGAFVATRKLMLIK